MSESTVVMRSCRLVQGSELAARLLSYRLRVGTSELQSIDEGPFQMGTFRETLAEGTEGALLQVQNDSIYCWNYLLEIGKDIWDNVKMLLKFELTKEDRESQLYDDFDSLSISTKRDYHDYYVWNGGRQNRGQGNNAQGGGVVDYGGAQNRVGNANPGQARQEVVDASSGRILVALMWKGSYCLLQYSVDKTTPLMKM
ncbi:hypothetical protein Tco_0564133 [Tanacetum coccineum]